MRAARPGTLERTIARLIAEVDLGVDRDTATWLCWSSMQALVVLEITITIINELGGGSPVSTSELVRRYTTLLLDGLRNG